MVETYKNPEVQFKIQLDNKHYNFNRLYSFANIDVFIITGGRGIGKTTGALVKALQNFRKNDEQFVYARRYRTELDKKSEEILRPILKTKYITKPLGKGAFEYVINNKRVGFALAVSLQQTYKSGFDFSKVTTIIYDEATLQRGGMYRYLKNEIEQFFELISTITRTRTNYKVFILGNNIDIFNPYNEYFNIPSSLKNNIYIDNDRGLYYELAGTKPELLEEEKLTPLYRLTKNTAYGDYHYDNKVLTVSKGIIAPKDYRATLMFRLVFNKQTLNVYRQNGIEIYVEWRDKVINDSMTYTIMENNNLNYYYCKAFKDTELCNWVRMCYYDNKIKYHNNKAIEIFSTFMELIK